MNFNEKPNGTSDEKLASSTNVFSSEDFAQSEDIILIIENSPAFYTMDISPNRFTKFIDTMQLFIKNRIKIDYRDRYFLYVFNRDVVSPTLDFENFSKKRNLKRIRMNKLGHLHLLMPYKREFKSV